MVHKRARGLPKRDIYTCTNKYSHISRDDQSPLLPCKPELILHSSASSCDHMVGENPRASGTEPHTPKATERAVSLRRILTRKHHAKAKRRIRKESPPSLLKTGDKENHMQDGYVGKETKVRDSNVNG